MNDLSKQAKQCYVSIVPKSREEERMVDANSFNQNCVSCSHAAKKATTTSSAAGAKNDEKSRKRVIGAREDVCARWKR